MSRLEAINNHVSIPSEQQEEYQAPTEVNLPELFPAFSYLLELFYLSGQATQTGMGLVPLSWREFQAFREENRLDLTLWERETIMRMSAAYCAEYSKSSDPSRPAPYRVIVDESEVDKVAKAMRIRSALSLFRKK